MDFSLNEEQRAWQIKAREFAKNELRPHSIKRDQIPGPFDPWDWEIIEKGSKLGFRTMAVPKEWGSEGTDFVSQALVMAELAKADSAMSKAFSQNWKWSHLIANACTEDQKERFLKPFLADHRYVIQRVTKLNMKVHGAEGFMMNARVDKLVRDAMVWTHLAADTVLRMKAVSKIKPPVD